MFKGKNGTTINVIRMTPNHIEYDFSLTVNETHGHKHGKGIYFTNDIDKALYYSERTSSEKYVMVCLVHVGDIMVGRMDTSLHPVIPGSSIDKTYDTSVDNLHSPIQFVKKKNGCYNILGIMKFDLNNSKLLSESFLKTAGVFF